MGLRIILFWFVLLGAMIAPGNGLAETEKDPHAVLSDMGECMRCHVDIPKRGAGQPPPALKKDVVSLCLDCHKEKDLSTLHPVDIRPGIKVPGDLPLDEHETITCATCHDPHGSYESDRPHVAETLSKRLLSVFTRKKTYRTFFLRRPNDQGQLCLACHKEANLAAEGFHVEEASLLDQYVGSERCKECHFGKYREWRRTSHARMTRDVRTDPGAVLADFQTDPPFAAGEVVYTLGNHWTQRYVVEKDGKLLVKAPIWSITQRSWDTSYWIDKPWTQYCQGCHTTGFEMKPDPRFVELGVGCEACHGPGRGHADSEGREPVVNPADLTPERRDMVCESCHTVGHDRTGQFRFPLGFLPGKDLSHYYRGLLPKPGQDNSTFTGDGSYEDRHRQWLFWVEHFMDAKGLSCDLCKSFRDRATVPQEKTAMTPAEYCLTCHQDNLPQSELHERHLEQAVGCHRCHVPSLAPDGRSYSIHDHKFMFGVPETDRPLSMKEACGQCHQRASAAVGG